eukprot:165884-Chlamydomonas_euryale.AAC.2
MRNHAEPCGAMQSHAEPCGTMQNHAEPCRTMRSHAEPCGTGDKAVGQPTGCRRVLCMLQPYAAAEMQQTVTKLRKRSNPVL